MYLLTLNEAGTSHWVMVYPLFFETRPVNWPDSLFPPLRKKLLGIDLGDRSSFPVLKMRPVKGRFTLLVPVLDQFFDVGE